MVVIITIMMQRQATIDAKVGGRADFHLQAHGPIGGVGSMYI
jgi:hypothetical protein